MQFIPTIINFFTPFITNFVIAPVLPLMLPPEPEPVKQEVPQSSSSYTSSYDVLSSWYGPGFHGNLTANGEVFDQYAMTAASPHLPFGTQLEVSYNGRFVIVTINDRGPYYGGRELDLSQGAAEVLGIDGVAIVSVKELN